jgi:hypothetical protein
MKTLHFVTLTLALSLSTFSVVQGYPDMRNMRVQDIAERFRNYQLAHVIQPSAVPRGCDYTF